MNPLNGLSDTSSIICLPQVDGAALLPFLHEACPQYQIAEADASAFDQRLADAAKMYAAMCRVGSGQSLDANRWYCAIDPVVFQADMRDVQLHSWPVERLTDDDAKALRGALLPLLREDPDKRVATWQLEALSPARWIVSATEANALCFEAAPAIDLLGQPLRASKPTGVDADVVQRLMTEIQMSLYQLTDGTGVSVNGVWFYGAGSARIPTTLWPLPTLYSDRLFFKGFWGVFGDGSATVHSCAPADTLQPGAVWAPREVPDFPAWISRSIQPGLLTNVVIHTSNARLIIRRRTALGQLFFRLQQLKKRDL